MNNFRTFYDGVLGRLLIAAGQPEAARKRLDTALALAQDTGMCFYDAELLRLRAHTHTDPDARRADITAALALARRQGATLFELRAALDDFELRGQPARAALVDAASRIPTNNAWPELVRARAALSATFGCSISFEQEEIIERATAAAGSAPGRAGSRRTPAAGACPRRWARSSWRRAFRRGS